MAYYTVVTAVGRAALAACAANGTPMHLSQMAVGDGGGDSYDPDAVVDTATTLVRELYRGDLLSVQTDASNPNWIHCQARIPPGEGGWYVREVGLYDADGDLIAIGSYPQTYKPIMADGSSIELVIDMVIQVTNADTVQFVVDATSILATQTWVADNVHGLPAGGNTGDTLVKLSDVDYDAGWTAPRRRINPYIYFAGQF